MQIFQSLALSLPPKQKTGFQTAVRRRADLKVVQPQRDVFERRYERVYFGEEENKKQRTFNCGKYN